MGPVPRGRYSDFAALATGAGLFVLLVFAGLAVLSALNRAQCSGESRPFLGSGRQTFAVYGCLARDAGPLIDIKKRLGIYDPSWKPVIK